LFLSSPFPTRPPGSAPLWRKLSGSGAVIPLHSKILGVSTLLLLLLAMWLLGIVLIYPSRVVIVARRLAA